MQTAVLPLCNAIVITNVPRREALVKLGIPGKWLSIPDRALHSAAMLLVPICTGEVLT
jgi:hypothetical protein